MVQLNCGGMKIMDKLIKTKAINELIAQYNEEINLLQTKIETIKIETAKREIERKLHKTLKGTISTIKNERVFIDGMDEIHDYECKINLLEQKVDLLQKEILVIQ